MIRAFSDKKWLAIEIAGDSRAALLACVQTPLYFFSATCEAVRNSLSPVSFLNAQPSIAIFLPVMVLNSVSTTLWANRSFWYSFYAGQLYVTDGRSTASN